MAKGFRSERDPLGELAVPADAHHGVQTARAVENFPIGGLRAPDDLVVATILVKKAAADANAAARTLAESLARKAEEFADVLKTGKSIRGLVLERGLVDAKKLDEILSADAMTRGGIVGAGEAGQAGTAGGAGKAGTGQAGTAGKAGRE